MNKTKSLIEFVKSKYLYKNIFYTILLTLIVDIILCLIGISFESSEYFVTLLVGLSFFLSIVYNLFFWLWDSSLLMDCFKTTLLIFIISHYFFFKFNKIKIGYIFTILFTLINIFFWFIGLSLLVT